MKNITNSSDYCISTLEKVASNNIIQDINTTYSQPANLIPHFWYYKVVDKDGSPDLPCIMILSELFGWFRNLPKSKTYYSTGKSLPELVDDQLAISYDYLSEKLNFQKERIRRKLVRLEELGILSRDVRNIALEDGSRIKQLYISIDYDFFNSCFRNPDFDIRAGEDDTISSYDSAVFERTPLLGGEHISNKNINRSIESNFNSKIFEEKNEKLVQQQSSSENMTFANSISKMKEAKKLQDFYPLTEQDYNELRSRSGREFTLNAMNEILKDISKKLNSPEFWSKKGFISYMSKCFKYEMRNPEQISGESFRIKSAMSKEELDYREKEKYLEEIEYSLQVSPEWHLKKKLASVLSTDKAYNLLTSYKQLRIEKGGICNLELKNHVKLSENDKNIILSQIQATHEGVGEHRENGFEKITTLNIKTPEYLKKKANTNIVYGKSDSTTEKIAEGRWKKIRNIFAGYYQEEEGRYLDKNWLSRLEAQIDEKQKIVNLRTPSEFYKDYIKNNLISELASAIQQEGFELNSIEC